MTREEAQCKPLHEVWEEFKTMTITGNPCRYQSLEWHGWSDLFDMLRDVLLNRCKKILSIDGDTLIDIEFGNIVSATFNNVQGTTHRRRDMVATAEDMSAAYGFWAWELKQRQDAGE